MSKIEDEVCKKIQGRAKVGLEKYGVTMERTDFSHLDWLIYAQEEAMDFAVYLQRMIEDEEARIEALSNRGNRDPEMQKLREQYYQAISRRSENA